MRHTHVQHLEGEYEPPPPARPSVLWPEVDCRNISPMMQHSRHDNPLLIWKIEQDVWRRCRPASYAWRQLVSLPAHQRLIQQPNGFCFDLVKHTISRRDAIFGNVSPSLQQVISALAV